MSAILDNGQIATASQVEQRIHGGRDTESVLDDQDARSRRYGLLHAGRIEVVGSLGDIRIDGRTAGASDGVRHNDAREARENYLVPCLETESLQDGIERHSSLPESGGEPGV